MAVLSIAGLHVTSRRPCWWCVRFKKKAFLSLGTKPNFHANSSRKNSIVLTTNTPPIWPPCHLIVSQECRSIKNIKNIKLLLWRHCKYLKFSNQTRLSAHYLSCHVTTSSEANVLTCYLHWWAVPSHQLHSKNNGPVLFFTTKLRHSNFFCRLLLWMAKMNMNWTLNVMTLAQNYRNILSSCKQSIGYFYFTCIQRWSKNAIRIASTTLLLKRTVSQ